MVDPRYPIGKFDADAEVEHHERAALIDQIAAAPDHLRAAVAGLDDAQLDTPYRAGGWTVRQVVHHVVDSHMNAYIRFHLALTENEPAVRAYDEKAWANLPDGQAAPVEISLDLLTALHKRWVLLLRTLTEADFNRPVIHPEAGRITTGRLLRLYAWHGRHHVAHITQLRAARAWH